MGVAKLIWCRKSLDRRFLLYQLHIEYNYSKRAANINNSAVVIHINTCLLSKEHIFSCSRVPIEQFSVRMQENGDVGDDAINRGVQYPFSVNEKVIIKVSSFHSLSILSIGPYFSLDQIGVIK